MKTKMSRVLRDARKILAMRQQIVAEHLAARNQAAVKFVQTLATVNQHRKEIAHSRLSVIEAAAKARQLIPKRPVDPLKKIADRHARTVAKLEARANLRSAVERQLRAQAAQAALDRAVFIDQVKRDLPAEMWEETIDTYDRRVYESSEGEAP